MGEEFNVNPGCEIRVTTAWTDTIAHSKYSALKHNAGGTM